MKRSELLFGILRILMDAFSILGVLLFAWWLRSHNIDLIPGWQLLESATTLPPLPYYVRSFVLPSIVLFISIAALLKLYLIRITLSFFREESRIILSVIVWVGLVMGWFFFVERQLFYSRILLIHATLFAFIVVSGGRVMLTLVQRMLLKKGIGVRNVLTIGSLPPPETVTRFLQRDQRYKYIGHSASLNNIERTLETLNIDLILQTDPSTSDATNTLIDFCRSNQIGYAFLPPVLIDVPHLLSVFRFGPVPVLRFTPTPLDGWCAILKRTGDTVASLIGLTLLSPLFLTIACLIKIDSRGSIMYRSKRIGQGGKNTINILKFRSMVQNADELKATLNHQSHRNDGPLFKIKNDPRVTRVGKILRRFSLDELPQLWNVLKGDLSIVGPRPHLPEEVERYTDFQKRVFAVKPGITGLAQISGRSNLA